MRCSAGANVHNVRTDERGFRAAPLSLVAMLVQPIGEGEAGQTLLFKRVMVRAEARRRGGFIRAKRASLIRKAPPEFRRKDELPFGRELHLRASAPPREHPTPVTMR